MDASDTTGFPVHLLGHPLLDRKNRQWFGTEKGLYLLLPGKVGAPVRFRRFTEKEGLPSNNTQGILEDEQGRIWLSTFNGLSRFDPELSGQAPDGLTFRNYRRSDGLQGNEFNFEACFKVADGRLYFGGVNGFNAFSPGEMRDDPIAPPLAITAVKVLRNNELQSLPTDQPLRLTHRDKVLTLEFAALHFADPERNQFAWKMEGFDPDWRFGGSQNEATYTNLDAGSYTFRVKAANKDGVWNEEGISLKIRVLPPWWQAWWAWILYVAAVVSGIYFYLKFRLQRQQEQAEALRIKELERLKSRLYTNITHEFRTPLTVILGMTERLESERPASEGVTSSHPLTLIRRNAKSLFRLVNQLLDLAKLEAGSLKPEWVQADVVPFVQYLTEAFQSFAEGKKIKLVFHKETERLVMDFDENKLQSVVSNLLSNAIKFTPEGGNIVLHASELAQSAVSSSRANSTKNAETLLQIKVTDTGIGIPADKLPHIFDRFYQVDDSNTRRGEGAGIGLALTKELVELMGGSISLKSTPGEGSEFRVQLPIRNAAPFAVSERVTSSHPLTSPLQQIESEIATRAEYPNISISEYPILLIIEDNADVVAYIRTCLESQYHILVAENGALGIEKALETVPDIILSDVMMPEMDGFEVCQALKNDERTSHVPIVLLTAKADVESRIEGLQQGADAYLAKPFDKKELLVVLEKLVELRRKLQAKYGDWRLLTGDLDAQSSIINHQSPEDAFLLKIRHIMETHFADADFGVARLCLETGMSQPQLYRKIKALTGKSTEAFLRSFRLQKARELLLAREWNVSEVAYRTGFSDPAYFSRAFSEEFRGGAGEREGSEKELILPT